MLNGYIVQRQPVRLHLSTSDMLQVLPSVLCSAPCFSGLTFRLEYGGLTTPTQSACFSPAYISYPLLQLCLVFGLRIENYWGNVALWCVYGLLFSIIDLVEEVFLCTVFTQMVPSSVQSFAESLRRLFTNIGGIFGILMSGSMFFAVLYICIGLIFNFLVCSFMLFIRRKKFMNPNYDAFL